MASKKVFVKECVFPWQRQASIYVSIGQRFSATLSRELKANHNFLHVLQKASNFHLMSRWLCIQ